MKRLFTIFLLISFSGVLKAQEMKPIELVEKVFTNKKFAKKTKKFSTGEYKGHPNANDLKENSDLSFKMLNKSENTAVINLTIKDNSENGIDTYVYLEKRKKWKISAFRALAMTGILQKIKSDFEKMSEKQIDSLIKSDKENFKSKEDFYTQLENIKLTLALDEKIIQHFKKNESKFEALKNEIKTIEIDKSQKSYRKVNLGKKVKSNYKDLLINTISTSHNCKNCYEFVIGGMIDNTVGYLYIPKGERIPKMNSSRLIMLREIGNGWYIFKTT